MTQADLQPPNDRRRAEIHWLCVIAVLFTWPLLLSGGQVTTYRVGMAVPDWPTTFGINMFLYRFVNTSWGVFIEHRHRLLGAALGLDLIVLFLWVAARDRTLKTLCLAAVALAGVIAQGVLGGLRVQRNSTALAAIHGCSGQLLFAYLVAFAIVTGRGWTNPKSAPVYDSMRLRPITLGLLAVFLTQLTLGAALRHFGIGLEFHISLAIIATAAAIGVAWLVESRRGTYAPLVRPVRALELAIAAQLTLGVLSWWMLRPFDGIPRRVTTVQALIRTGHQGTGAIALAAATVLCLSARRCLIPAPTRERVADKASSGSPIWETAQ